MNRIGILLALFVPLGVGAPALAADDFKPATVLEVEAKNGLANPLLGGPGLEADSYTVVTVQLGDLKISARTLSLGGGIIYLSSHPEALVVGSTTDARLAKAGNLEIRTAGGKVLKFHIQRMEKTPPPK